VTIRSYGRYKSETANNQPATSEDSITRHKKAQWLPNQPAEDVMYLKIPEM